MVGLDHWFDCVSVHQMSHVTCAACVLTCPTIATCRDISLFKHKLRWVEALMESYDYFIPQLQPCES